MTFVEQRDRALALMAETPVPFIRYAPPMHRLLWRFGVEVRPPHFGGLWPATLQMALVSLVFARQFSQMMDLPWVVAAAGLALLYTVGLPDGYRGEVDGLGLPTWEELDERDIHLRPGSIFKLSGPTRAS